MVSVARVAFRSHNGHERGNFQAGGFGGDLAKGFDKDLGSVESDPEDAAEFLDPPNFDSGEKFLEHFLLLLG